MCLIKMALLMLSAGLFDTVLSGVSNVIPSKEEQANLLTNVQEVFEQVKLLVNIEANSTDESVVQDIDKIVQRAEDTLKLVQDLAFTRMSYVSNSVCMLDYKPLVRQEVSKGIEQLKDCITISATEVILNSRHLTNVSEFATGYGQNFMKTLEHCSKKPGLQVISCYKNIILNDVIPLKKTLLNAINEHKAAHFETIKIRNEANNCVDRILDQKQKGIAETLERALQCSSK